jgi:hypothetical protein
VAANEQENHGRDRLGILGLSKSSTKLVVFFIAKKPLNVTSLWELPLFLLHSARCQQIVKEGLSKDPSNVWAAKVDHGIKHLEGPLRSRIERSL